MAVETQCFKLVIFAV